MARPEQRMITFTIDGREVHAPENMMLVDAAKLGDVEIPVFCYEPKLGKPVGACRMCLVEIEGIPKLQTGCSTPVKDGMVVNTVGDRVQTAQKGVVEFLLLNHPLDCPVCDKGGECPLQDIAFGWGGGISRFVETKRHFVKPVKLSSQIAIDRERCILCYRCVRFSQDVSEDHQLVLLERGAHSYVATFDGHPYEAPFSGNIVELCPVGALTALPYRFKARPWDIEDAGTICTLCPSQCNVALTVRDEKVLRAMARDNPEVDEGWLCNRGRFVRDEIHGEQRITEPMIRDAGVLRPVPWDVALERAAGILGRAGERAAAVVGGQTTNEEGFLLSRLIREGLGSPHIDSRASGSLPLAVHRSLADPDIQLKTSDVLYTGTVLVLDCEPIRDMPILDLRIRKGIRQHGVRLAVATQAKSALDRRAELAVRYAPGMGAVFAQALAAAVADAQSGFSNGEGPAVEGQGDQSQESGEVDRLAGKAGADTAQVRELGRLLCASAGNKGRGSPEGEPVEGSEVAILWGERLTAGPDGTAGAEALLQIASRLGLAGVETAGLMEVPAGTNSRGLREAGVLPNAGPGLAEPVAPAGVGADGGSEASQNGGQPQGGPAAGGPTEGGPTGLDVRGIAEALAGGTLSAVHLMHCDPLAEGDPICAGGVAPTAVDANGDSQAREKEIWEQGLARAGVVAHASKLTAGIAEHADVVFPAESHAEKEGTMVHPDGRLQRLRPAIGRQGDVRPEWMVIADVAILLGLDLGVQTGRDATSQLVEAVPFYAELTLEEIGGKGVRWQERPAYAGVGAGVLGAGSEGAGGLGAGSEGAGGLGAGGGEQI